MNPNRIVELLGRLAILKFFPAGNDAVLEGLLCLVGDMCSSEAEVEWLVKRMTSGIYSEWPGPAEMRACFCSRHKPKDGLNAYSTVYPDGIPLSKPMPLITPPPVRAFLTAPEGTASPFQEDWDARKQRAKITQVAPDFKPITQVDVDNAVRKVREEKAKRKPKDAK